MIVYERLRQANRTQHLTCDDGYEALANAIIIQATVDYRKAIREFDIYEMKRLRRFFHSDWYKQLTKVDGDYIIQGIEREEIYGKNKGKFLLRKEIQGYDN